MANNEPDPIRRVVGPNGDVYFEAWCASQVAFCMLTTEPWQQAMWERRAITTKEAWHLAASAKASSHAIVCRRHVAT